MKPPSGAPITTDVLRHGLGRIDFSEEELEQLAQSLCVPTASDIRLRRETEPSTLPFATDKIDWYRLGRCVLDDSVRPSKTLSYFSGDFFPQDRGAMLALAACGADREELCDNEHGLLICDLCASSGGNASALLEAIGDTGFLLANEPVRSRTTALSNNLGRTGSDRYAICNEAPEILAKRLPGIFDLVLVDAPSSGKTIASRNGQTTACLSERQINNNAEKQERIVAAACKLLRPGGQLVYSTCTFTEAENEAQISPLIDNSLAESMERQELSAYRSDIGPDGCYRLWPHRNKCTANFVASLRVLDSDPHARTARSWKRGKGDKSPAPLEQFFQFTKDDVRLKHRENVVFAWPTDAPNWVDDLAVAGPDVIHRIGQTWKPTHSAAIRRIPRVSAQQVLEVDAETAIAFATGAPIECATKGWNVVQHDGKPLGWIKASGGVGKNQLPPAAKVSGDLS